MRYDRGPLLAIQMKQRKIVTLVLTAGILLFLSSCSTSKIVFDVINPAKAQLPEGLENATVINLVSPSMEDRLDDISDLLKGKGELMNQIAAQGAIAGFNQELQMNTGIQLMQTFLPDNQIITSADNSDTSWKMMDSICLASGVKTIIALKSFESKTEMDYSGYERRTLADPVKVWSNTLAYDVATDYVYIARLKAYVEIGWKVFYPAGREMMLDQAYVDSVFTEAEGMSKNEAERMLPGIKNAVEDAGFIAGSRFARRFSPGRTTVERKYFTSGNDDFKQANNYVKMRYWDKAAEFWQKNIENPHPKIAGTARYNLALVREMNGKLEEAIDLVESTRQSYHNSLMDEYLQILKQRDTTRDLNPDRK